MPSLLGGGGNGGGGGGGGGRGGLTTTGTGCSSNVRSLSLPSSTTSFCSSVTKPSDVIASAYSPGLSTSGFASGATPTSTPSIAIVAPSGCTCRTTTPTWVFASSSAACAL